MTRLLTRACLLTILAGVSTAPAFAASEIGVAAATVGTVEVRRASAGDWKTLDLGAPIFPGDEFRTGEHGRLKILFADETVLDLGASTELTVKEYAAAGSKRGAKTVVGLATGGVRALLGEVYAGTKASYELETPTAIVRAPGTVFVVRHDAAAKSTEVFGIEGEVEVQGSIGLIGPVVKVGPGERTEVQAGKFPVPVAAADEAVLTAVQDEVEIIGSGQRDGLAADHPIMRGELARADERPDAMVANGVTAAARSGVSFIEPGVPGETLRDRNSPALRANTQPIPEYKFAAPDEVPPP